MVEHISKPKLHPTFVGLVLFKLLIASALAYFWDYGVYLILAYCLYRVERNAFYQYINGQEMNRELNILHNNPQQNVQDLKSEIALLKDRQAELELNLIELETHCDR